MHRQQIYDVEGLLADQSLIAATAAGLVSAAAAEFDTGGGHTKGKLVINVTAIEVDDGDESYEFILQGSNTSGFGSGKVSCARLRLGCDSVITEDADTGTGRWVIPFTNEVNGTVYRYLRIYLVAAGTVTVGINYGAWITK